MNMVSPKDRKDVALIIGPTASGKSALALELAKKQPSVVVNADSAQVYADLQILSARPTLEEMGGIEHRLYGYIDGAQACSAAQWANDAKAEISRAHETGLLPILVGGTGLYVRTLLEGIAPVPEIDTHIRGAIRQMDIADAYRALEAEDPAAAARLNPSDASRIMRALEVIRSTGKPLDHWHKNKSGGIGDRITLKPVILLPPRDWLYERCDRRFDVMMESGAAAEVERLIKRNLPDDCPVMRAIGVQEIASLNSGQIERHTAISQAQIATRQYAKRQYTWFRNQCPADWPRYAEKINNDSIKDIIILFQ